MAKISNTANVIENTGEVDRKKNNPEAQKGHQREFLESFLCQRPF